MDKHQDLMHELAQGYRGLYSELALTRTWRENRLWIIVIIILGLWGILSGHWAFTIVEWGFALFLFSTCFYRECFYIATEVEAREEVKRRGIIDET